MNLYNTNPFLTAKKNKSPLILDGAMGSLLQQRGFELDERIWGTNVNELYPKEVIKIHKEYIKAGADIITTNTFRTNPLAFVGSSYNFIPQYIKDAVHIAKEAIGDLPILIAGSNAPAEDCYKKEREVSYYKLKLNHINHIDLLIDNGVDFILNETQSHLDEIGIICEYSAENKIPFVISLFITQELRLLSGEYFFEVINFIEKYAPLAIGVNCISPRIFMDLLPIIPEYLNWGFYLNCGSGNYTDITIKCGINPIDYIGYIKESMKHAPSFIGACCGSNPKHIKAIKKLYE